MIDGLEAGDRFSLVEHAMSPRALAAPLHLHTREDEYNFKLESVPELVERFGLRIGEPLSGGWTPLT